MNSRKFFQLNSIEIDDKTIFPIFLLKVAVFNDIFFNIEYEVSAFKIIQENKIYYKNVNLNNKDFEYIKNYF